MKKKTTCKTQNCHILPVFLLIIIVLLIAVSIYCYLIKYRAKQKYWLLFHVTNNALKKFIHGWYKLKMSNKYTGIYIKNTQTTITLILAMH